MRDLPEVWRRPIGGGAEEQMGDTRKAGMPTFSPDGRLFHRLLPSAGPSRGTRPFEIVDVATGRAVRTLAVTGGNLRWAPSSDALLFTRRVDGAVNIWRLPIDGGPMTQHTHFGPDQLPGPYTYTADGTLLLFSGFERTPGEVVQFRNWR